MLFDFDVSAAFALCSGSVHFVGLFLGVGAYFMYNTIVSSLRPVAPRLIGHRFKTVDSETSSLDTDDEDASENIGFDVGVSNNVADTGTVGRDARVAVSRQPYTDEMQETTFAKRMRDVPAVPRVCLVVGCVVVAVVWVCSAYSNHRQNVCTSWRRGPNAIAVALWASMPPAQPSVTSSSRQLHARRSSATVKASITNTCQNPTDPSMAATCMEEASSSPADVQVDEFLKVPSSPIIELVHSSHSALMPLCKAIGGQLRGLRKAAKPRELRALGTLISLQRLEEPYRALLTALRLAHAFAESTENMSHVECSTGGAGVGAHDANNSLSCGRSEELKMELHGLGSSMTVCMLDALQEGRLVAVMLSHDETLVKQAVSCEPSLLEGLEATVVGEADDADDSSVVFALGVYWSDVGVATSDAPFFGIRRDSVGVTSWQKDEMGTSSRRVPATMARAEALLLRGEEGTVGMSRADRTSIRALRLYQHAKALALMHHDMAAESRYLLAAELAASVDRHKLAVHSLTRLSYFLHLRGHHSRALDMAEKALTHGSDPLAIYLKATLRRSLGQLRTVDDIVDAETNLRAVAKTLPSRELEKQRTAAQVQLELWRRAATEGARQEDLLGVFKACTALGDVAHVLICGLCWCLLESSPLSVPQNSSLTVMDGDVEVE